jgi:hypothetical protein
MFDKLWDLLVDSAYVFFVPLVCSYFALTSNIFLNTSCEEATGLEKLGNYLLVPCHYLFVGQTAKKDADGEWVFSNRFNYMDDRFVAKTVFSSIAVIPSFVVGVLLKTISLLTEGSRINHRTMYASCHSTKVELNKALYGSYEIGPQLEKEWFESEGLKRRPGDENIMRIEKQAVSEIAGILNREKIPWWVDCGTCLGAYRYGGIIPWDQDIDIAVFLHDFENVRSALNRLSPTKYIVQDWSTREHPKSYLKVYIRESGTQIDIYHFKILPEKQQIQYVLSMEHHSFFPEWWKIREKRFTVPASFDDVFPLKRVMFDGIEVNIPKNIKKYLQRYYGENLSPAKIYDPITKKYEKDLSHPYWQRAFVH